MSDKNPDKELSMDELKDVSGGIRSQGGGYKTKDNKTLAGKKVVCFEDNSVVAEGDGNDYCESQFVGTPILSDDISLS